MSKQSMRDEAERLVREALERKTVAVKQGNTRIEAICGKCGAPNRVTAAPGETVVLRTTLNVRASSMPRVAGLRGTQQA